jgi:PEP-CTERM motif
MRRLLLIVAVVGLALARGSPALADVFNSTINTPNSAISGFSGPYASVSVDLTSPTTATITFTANTVGGNTYLFGDGGSVALNVNATSFTATNITGTNSGTGFLPGSPFTTSSGAEDGFGNFNLQINSFDGFTHSSSTISFTLTNTSGGTWSSASQVLVANSSGFDAAAHIFVTSSPANAANGALATGFAAEGATVVPEPGSMALFGSGLLLLGGAVRRRWHSRHS